jgi:hypothetical protein
MTQEYFVWQAAGGFGFALGKMGKAAASARGFGGGVAKAGNVKPAMAAFQLDSDDDD